MPARIAPPTSRVGPSAFCFARNRLDTPVGRFSGGARAHRHRAFDATAGRRAPARRTGQRPGYSHARSARRKPAMSFAGFLVPAALKPIENRGRYWHTAGYRWRRWREGKVRPMPGNSPFHATRFGHRIHAYGAPRMRFPRHGGIYLVRCGRKTKPRGETEPPPAGRPRAQVEERVGRTTPLLIVRR